MKGKLISEDAQRTFAVILDTDDEVVGCLTAFAKEQRLSAGQFDLNGPILISADAGQCVDWLAQFCAIWGAASGRAVTCSSPRLLEPEQVRGR